jgi:hypothetical protein
VTLKSDKDQGFTLFWLHGSGSVLREKAGFGSALKTFADPQHCFIVEFCRTAGEGGGAVRTEGRSGRPGGGGHGSATGNPGHTHRIPESYSDPHLFRRGSRI